MEIAPIYFPIFFIGVWLLVTTIFGFISGWYSLAQYYPDRPNELPVVKFSNQSGYIGSISILGSMRGVLKLSACRSGLRVGIMRIFGPFCKDFFVPWNEIKIKRKDFFSMKYAELSFGVGTGTLGIETSIADRFWRALPDAWPEHGNPPTPAKPSDLKAQVFRWWLVATVIGATFFIFVSRSDTSSGDGPPIAVAILFPAIAFGIFSIFEYARRSGLNK